MSDVTIAATTRTVSGKGQCRKLRAAGQVPAVLNTAGKSTLLALDPKLLSKAWQGGKKFVLDLGGQKSNVKITELQIHPVRRLPLHVDLAPAD